MKNNKRWLSLLLVFVMMLSVMPLNVFAVEDKLESPSVETPGSSVTKLPETSEVKQPTSDAKVSGTPAPAAATGHTVTITAVGTAEQGTSIPFKVVVKDSSDNEITTATLSYSYTPNTGQSSVTGGNLKIGDNETVGPLTVEVFAKVGDEVVASASKTINVTKKPATITAVKNITATINVGGNFLPLPATTTVKWSDNSETEELVTWDPNQSAAIDKNTAGEYTVNGKLTNHPTKTLTYTLTVTETTPAKTVTSVDIDDYGTSTTMKQGANKLFSATVSGTGLTNAEKSKVTWKLTGANKTGTEVTDSGRVYIASNETASYVTLTATSNVTGTTAKSNSIRINIDKDDDITSVTIDQSSKTLKTGDYYTFSATVKGSSSNKDVKWTVSGANKSGTEISSSGKLYIASNETASRVTVKATSKADSSKSDTVTVYISDYDNSSNRDREVYPSNIDVNDGYRVEGRLSNYTNTKIYVYYDGREVGSGYTDSNGYFDIKTDKRVYKDSSLRFYTNSSSTTSSKTKVYPNDIYLYNDNRRVEGKLTSYKNTKVYVYYDGSEIGSGYTNSDGKFDISLDRRVSSKSDLTFYVASSSDKTKAASITSAKAGEYKIEGTAAAYATVTVKDKDNVKLGSATADKDGKFTIYANRTLKSGEKLTITTSESGKSDNTTTYTVSESKTADLKRIAYIKGYPNGNFKPHGNITRGEAATMFARLLNNSDNFGTTKTTKFTDANNQWYSEAINYVVNKGLISGYPDGTFKPNANITRAEFAQMISGYVTVGGNATNFKDVNDHWAKEAIEKLYGNKSVTGYPDGTFKPNDEITRAEAVTILNSVFGRVSNTQSFDSVKSSLKSFGDVKSSDWFYANVMDASNAHDSYRKSSTDDTEVWTKIN